MIDASKSPKKRLSMKRVKIAKKNLRHLIKNGWSLRKLSDKLNNAVTYQTLGRVINEKDYIPAGEAVREALDLLELPNPYRILPRWYKRIPEALEYFNEKRMQIKSMSDGTKRKRM
jgi:lambda repressor-like predicted transcriptional regulator